jgi:putative redox protein
MALKSEKITFANDRGQRLAARLEKGAVQPRAFAVFAHCFTCSKDIKAASRVSRSLAEAGFGVLRFDFTGLGNSEGDFSNTNFSSNVQDLLAACNYLANHHQAPAILVGHSLGGAAVLAAAGHLENLAAVATIGAPSSPEHVVQNFQADLPKIEADGEACVTLAGRQFKITAQFLDDVRHQHDQFRLPRGTALAVFHSPQDQVVSIENARDIFEQAKHPKSFISLDGADHLLSDPQDAEYVAQVLAAWASRYLPAVEAEAIRHESTGESLVEGEVLVTDPDGNLLQKVATASHTWLADEPVKLGGQDKGPNPFDLLNASLGVCTAMTMRMYAKRKEWPLAHVRVRVTHEQTRHDGELTTAFKRRISLQGALEEDQRKRLVEIANKCPVRRTLSGTIHIETEADPSA